MDIKNKNIIVFGLGITGISSIKALSKLSAKVYVYEDSDYDSIKSKVEKIKSYDFEIIENIENINWNEIYCVIKSPGIRLDNPFIKLAEKNKAEVISDIEIAYRIYGGENIIAITGTNGKTTITTLINYLLNKLGSKSEIAGNIGVGLLWQMFNAKKDTYFVLECSSFQLASIRDFKPKFAIISNITPDHIDWHGSFENYKEAKFNIFKNMTSEDLLILNKDDKILKEISKENIKYFSINEKADIYYDGKYIIYKDKKMDRTKIHLIGNHNVQNIMAAFLVLLNLNYDFEEISKYIEKFKGIEHRIEYVAEINGVKYYNDSKGTNTDSTKVALEGFEKNVILIAGGYDKNVEFDELFINNKNIKLLILMGATRDKIEKTAIKYGIKNIYKVNNMKEAVKIAFENAIKGDTVLLSPACASWGLYNNYEDRGKDFKELVKIYEKKYKK